jgi:hypothetical protein
MHQSVPIVAEDIFSILADKQSVEILNAALLGLRSSANSIINQSKKQYYVRLKRLVEIGLIEKQGSIYKLTTFGAVVHANHLKTLEKVIPNFWHIKSIDVLRNKSDLPMDQKENVLQEYLGSTTLSGMINATQLTSFNVVKRFDSLIPEVLRVLDNAESEVYFATRYHDPHISNKVIEKFGKGLTLHILDGNPEQISVENRLAAIIRTPPNREFAQLVRNILKSPRFDLKRLPTLPVSFMIVDGIQVVYETVNYINPEQFTIAVCKYDDAYMAHRFIEYFKLLAQDSQIPELFQVSRKK